MLALFIILNERNCGWKQEKVKYKVYSWYSGDHFSVFVAN